MFTPFDLQDETSYQRWHDWKLAHVVDDVAQLIVKVNSPNNLQAIEKKEIEDRCSRYNMAIYEVCDGSRDKSLVHELGKQLGLSRLDSNLRADEDSVTSLEVRAQSGNQYIPYTNKPLSWHTDGYYNTPDQQVRGIIMHCVEPSAEGGVNALVDHELLYIRLRDENPQYINALMNPQAMTIPANIEQGVEIRGAQSGPVFSVDTQSGQLHMRYSARKRNIEWCNDEITLDAASRITELLADESMVVRYCLKAGQGIICNNVLHNRSGFEDSSQQHRLMYRARYYDRIANTGIDNIE